MYKGSDPLRNGSEAHAVLPGQGWPPMGRFGPLKFAAAVFQFAGGRLDLKIPIHYL